MDVIERVKVLQADGWTVSAVAQHLGLDRKTVRKYMQQEDFSIPVPAPRRRASQLDAFTETIDAWLQEDQHHRFKQRHTARRVHDRLTAEFPETYRGSYVVVQRYVKARRQQTQAPTGTLDLVWYPGECQVDFGEADVVENGVETKTKFLVITFPYSNAGYVQLFRGETAECVVQGLRDLFDYLQGVPRRLVFDNASGVGRRIGERVRMTELFGRFAAHYGFETTFCNPYAGHEKGAVENQVGYWRRNLWVPLPQLTDLVAYNATLWAVCEADRARSHYRKGVPIHTLFAEDRAALRALPPQAFEPYRYTQVRTNGYGHFRVEGAHWYSTAPEYANQHVTVRMGAHLIQPLTEEGAPIVSHRRQFGTDRSESMDYRTTVHQLWQNPGAWRNSPVRTLLPAALQAALDQALRADLQDSLRALQDLSARYDWDHAVRALDYAREQGRLTYDHATVVAQRFAEWDTLGHDATPVDLGLYDELLPGGITP